MNPQTAKRSYWDTDFSIKILKSMAICNNLIILLMYKITISTLLDTHLLYYLTFYDIIKYTLYLELLIMNRLFYLTTILGLLLIILNIFLDLSYIPEIPLDKHSLKWILTVLSKASSTIGLALLLGNLTKIFNKKDEKEKETSRKNELLDIIESTVVSKSFLQTLSTDAKKDIIAKLLTPENNSLNKHSNVQEYLNAKSDKYLNFFNINFRSNMNIDIKITKEDSSTTSRYVARYKIYYRIYKINEHYQPIYITSEKDHKILDTILKDNEGKN